MLTQDKLKHYLTYDPSSGEFTRRVRPPEEFKSPRAYKSWMTRFGGKAAGHPWENGTGLMYLQVSIDGTTYYGHRLAWLYTYGTWPEVIDHINGDGLDNSMENLRDVSHQENLCNAKRRSDNTSGETGVSFLRGKWRSRISGDHLGSFNTFEEAVYHVKKEREKRSYHKNHGRG